MSWVKRDRRSADGVGMRDASPRRLRDSRGATLVEYALIVALVVVPSLGAIAGLDDASGDYYSTASDDIGDLPQLGIDNGATPPTSSGSSSSTTAPPTTAAPTTTTTAPPTTTTTAPTTTTTMATTTSTLLRSRISELVNISTNDGSNYNAVARVKIVRNSNGTAVSNASVTVRMVDNNGSVTTRSCTTSSTGRCQVTWNRSDWRAPVVATVTSVSSNPTWDGAQQSVTLYHP